MADGKTVEVATIGKEGMVGVPVLLGGDGISLHMIAQIPGPALAIKREDFTATINDGAGGLPPILLRYIQALLTQIAQQSACNRSHLIAQRCARWILMTHDRAGKAEFPLTHEFLAMMLGVRRPGVTMALHELKHQGVIACKRSHIVIVDRQALEEMSNGTYV